MPKVSGRFGGSVLKGVGKLCSRDLFAVAGGRPSLVRSLHGERREEGSGEGEEREGQKPIQKPSREFLSVTPE